MNAIKFLTNEHDKIRACFKKIKSESNTEEQKKEFEEFSKMLLRHEKMEQTVWYPELEKCDSEHINKTIEHLICEEKEAKKLIEEMKDLKSDTEWETKFTKLNTDVEHHASEEENKLFPTVSELLNEDKLEALGKKMVEFANQHV